MNFQRVPVVDTSNPFIARDIPTADESVVRDPASRNQGIDFPYLLNDDPQLVDEPAPTPSWCPGGKMELAMQLIFTPFIWRMMERRQRALNVL